MYENHAAGHPDDSGDNSKHRPLANTQRQIGALKEQLRLRR